MQGAGVTDRERLLNQRMQETEAAGAINSEEGCSVQKLGCSLYVTITQFGEKYHNIEKGDSVTVHTLPGGVFIETGGEDA